MQRELVHHGDDVTTDVSVVERRLVRNCRRQRKRSFESQSLSLIMCPEFRQTDKQDVANTLFLWKQQEVALADRK